MADDLENDQLMAENARLMADLQRASEAEAGPGVARRVPVENNPLIDELRQTIDNLLLRVDELERHKTVFNEGQSTGAESCTTSSPTTIGAAAEGSESASSTTWAVASGAVEVWITTRVGYFHAGDATVYGYARKFTFNSCGKLTAISAETRYTIDIAEA